MAQVSLTQQRRVTEMVLQGIKDIFPSLPYKIKDSISLKKAWQGDGFWTVQKEILGWILNSKAGTFQLPSRRLKELKALLEKSPNQRHITFPKLRSLIGKLRSILPDVPGPIWQFLYI